MRMLGSLVAQQKLEILMGELWKAAYRAKHGTCGQAP